jgi:hypothetical protein
MSFIDAVLGFCAELRPAFRQERTTRRASALMLSALLCVGRKWITRMLCVQGREQVDWSADYKLFSRASWKARDLFLPAIRESLKHFDGGPIVIAGDETRTRRGGRKVKRSRWTRDPMSPPFHTNFIKGIRWLQFSALLPLHRSHQVSACGAPISFEPIDLPQKPRRGASTEQWAEYEKRKRENRMCLKAVEQLRRLRLLYDQAGAVCQKLVVALDGAFCNRFMFQAGLERVALVVRARKDASLCFPANDPDRPRKVYADEKFTPEQVRSDDSRPWSETKLWFGGKRQKVRYKEVTNVLWQRGAKRKRLRLFVLAPTPYRLSPGMPKYYRQPAYLLVDDLELPADIILQAYLDRWQIEVNHRDEKQHIGVTDAQVWNDDSVDRVPAFMVAAYSFLLLGAIKAFGPERTEQYLRPPKWQRKRRQRPSCLDLLAKLREEAGQASQRPDQLNFNVDLIHVLLRAA